MGPRWLLWVVWSRMTVALSATALKKRSPSNAGWYRLPSRGALEVGVEPVAAPGTSKTVAEAIGEREGATLIVLGTYPADFNLIEYTQKLKFYGPKLAERGVTKTALVVNGDRSACEKFASLLAVPDDIELLSDPSGTVGREFGVLTGWIPDASVPASVKLFGMLFGLGAVATLPSVITGYLGNPSGTRGWIESAIAANQGADRWPSNVVETRADGTVALNKFDDLPIVGNWGRRPLELATLRLQNMLGISIANWDALKPSDDRCLTQLGGCALFDAKGDLAFFWRDNGICNVACFDSLLEVLDGEAQP